MNEANLTIYHNPECSKSRETLDILNQHEKLPEIIEYQDSPPDRQALERIIDLLGISARDQLRTGEPPYQVAKLDWDSVSDEAILDAIGEHSSLLQRPIVFMGNRAVIGRPPERVLELIG